jgi:hypothetical protein
MKIWEYLSYFLWIFLALLVFWVSHYGSISILQSAILAVISFVIVYAFQGTKNQAIERGLEPKGKRLVKSIDTADYFSCSLSMGLLCIILLYWIVLGALPTPFMIVGYFQIGGLLIFITVFVWSIYRVDQHIPAVDSRAPGRGEAVWNPRSDWEFSLPRRRVRTTKPIPGVTHALSEVRPTFKPKEEIVKAWRSGEFIGSRMRYKVKVQNESEFTVTDVMIYIISFPEESLKMVEDDDSVHHPKLEPKGLLTQTFDFMPTQDCVRGEINAGISFVDREGKVHTLSTKPFVIRSVCDLLLPHKVTPEDFELKLKDLDCGEVVLKIDEWTPEEMFEKGLRIVDESNFFEVSNQMEEREGIIFAKITGFALGKYTSKEVGVEISITGPTRKKGATCTIQVSGEDEAMILPTIDDLRERLNAWLCPLCSSPLSIALVEDLRDGEVVECPFCKVTIGR